jgi:Spx/MgsR family transcriptional regulator
MAKLVIFGIPNCDTTQKAMALLKKYQVDFIFHDYKQQGITTLKLEQWCEALGWERIFNKRSTSWRDLGPELQKMVVNQQAAIVLMMEKNSIIKRPIIEFDGKIIIGFNETEIIKQLKK